MSGGDLVYLNLKVGAIRRPSKHQWTELIISCCYLAGGEKTELSRSAPFFSCFSSSYCGVEADRL
ncbi:hypothetical protein MA16_Dca019323 [Dendrobium catenatum]|uniref:Uncharacterized protein n=1 Tax=Dendrobium catenatum TaxID=906689 RepID=A0A2I0WHY9_9ASPA|nr:hypothetical protein MA16_Dca019323 [Dendrobium catenatum]